MQTGKRERMDNKAAEQQGSRAAGSGVDEQQDSGERILHKKYEFTRILCYLHRNIMNIFVFMQNELRLLLSKGVKCNIFHAI